MLRALLNVRWTGFRNGLLRGAAADRRRAWMALVFSALLLSGVALVAGAFLDPFVRNAEVERSFQLLLSRLPSFILFSVFWMLLLSAITVGIQSFYLSPELALLLAAPLRPRTVFLSRFLEATAANASLFLAMGAPVGLAYGWARGLLAPQYVLALTVALLLFAAIPTAVGLLLSFLLMRVLPAGRTRDLLAAIAVTVFALLYFLVSASLTRMHGADAEMLRDRSAALLHAVNLPVMGMGPWAWAGRALSGDLAWPDAWSLLGTLGISAVAIILVAALAAQELHWRGWAASQEAGGAASETAHAQTGAGWEERLSFLPGAVRAMLLKEMRTLRRDMRQLSMLLLPIAVVALFLFNLHETGHTKGLEPVLLAQSLFIMLAPISLRLAMAAFVSETGALWLSLSSPNDPLSGLTGKFLYAYLLSLPLGMAATGGYAALMGVDGGRTLLCMLMVAFAMAGFCGIGVGASARLLNFRAEGGRGLGLSAGARIAMLGLQMAFLLALSLVTVGAWLAVRWQWAEPGAAYGVSAVMVAALCAGFTTLPLLWGAARLRNAEWGK